MTQSEFKEAFRLLDSAAALLDNRGSTPNQELALELKRLVLALDLLRIRIRQAPAESRRN